MSKLIDLRKKNNLSLQDMADRLHISKTFYWQLEHGQRRISYNRAYEIAKIFDLKPDDVFYDEVNQKERTA